jgi:hypothetical protein
MATCKMLGFEPLQEGGRFVFANATTQDVSQELATYFTGRRYKLESGTPFEGSYGIGSNLLRILFGIFAKRYVFSFNVLPQGEGCQLTMTKAISGAMGGVIGYRRMNKELEAILAELRTRFA